MPNINNNSNNEKALWFKLEKFSDENTVDSLDLKLGTIRFNLYSKYITTCLNIFSDYKDILKQPIIKSLENIENSILVQKQLLKMKKYIYNYILNLPEEKKNIQIKEYFKFLEKEIENGIKIGIESDIYEINYLFNFFPKGIEISFDYDVFELIYYNSKKNNKISGKALIPSPELYFKLDFDKIDIKIFDFEVELEDLEDVKYILLEIWKIIKDKINVAKLFIEPCLTDIRINLEQKRDSAKIKMKKKNKFDLLENIKKMKKNNNLNVKNNNTNPNSNNNSKIIKEENKINNNSHKTNKVKANNLTFTSKEELLKCLKDKENEENENINPSLSIEKEESEVKKIKINKVKNIAVYDSDEEKYSPKKNNEIFKEENIDLNISNDIKEKEE